MLTPKQRPSSSERKRRGEEGTLFRQPFVLLILLLFCTLSLLLSSFHFERRAIKESVLEDFLRQSRKSFSKLKTKQKRVTNDLPIDDTDNLTWVGNAKPISLKRSRNQAVNTSQALNRVDLNGQQGGTAIKESFQREDAKVLATINETKTRQGADIIKKTRHDHGIKDVQHLRSQQKQKGLEKKSMKALSETTVKASNNKASSRHSSPQLNCDAHGGPNADVAQEMIYWEDIPPDSRYVSPFKRVGVTKYITFDPEYAGWNNVRMQLETLIVMAIATGRTLVMPPKQNFWMPRVSVTGYTTLTSSDYFDLTSVVAEHAGLDIIAMEEFLHREAFVAGNLRDDQGRVSFPPNNRTNWDGADLKELRSWLRNVTFSPLWDYEHCMLAIPGSSNPKDAQELKNMEVSQKKSGGFPGYQAKSQRPVPVDAPTIDRLKENWAESFDGNRTMCVYDETYQRKRVLHFPFDLSVPGGRVLVHFYAFLFFQDWKQDLWMKRFVRDHLRYIDSIQCAAARIVNAIRQRSRSRGDPNGNYDSFHVRRGDFGIITQTTQVDANVIYETSREVLVENATIYVATDETDRSFFDPLSKHYDVVFLDNFKDLIAGVHSNYHGVIEQLVVSRSRSFFGCFYSTFTGYINRLRGYHANKLKAPGYEDGVIASWHYAPPFNRDEMRQYVPIYQRFFYREFPTSWRLIDKGIDEKAR